MFENLEANVFLCCLVKTPDGKLTSLDQLTPIGKSVFCVFMHLLLKEGTNHKANDTYNGLLRYKNFKISNSTFHKYLLYHNETNYIVERSGLVEKIQKTRELKIAAERQLLAGNNPPFTDEKLEKLKTSCGKHSLICMANELETLKGNIWRIIKLHDLKFEENSNCYFCETQKPSIPTPEISLSDAIIGKLGGECESYLDQEMDDDSDMPEETETESQSNQEIGNTEEGTEQSKASGSDSNEQMNDTDLLPLPLEIQTLVESHSNQEIDDNISERTGKPKLKKSDFNQQLGDVDVDERTEVLKTSCGSHTYGQMGECLGISKSMVTYRVHRFDMTFVENTNCYFCKWTKGEVKGFSAPAPNVTTMIHEKLRTNCGNHPFKDISECLGISRSSVQTKLKKFGIQFRKDNTDCHFCKWEKGEVASQEKRKRNPALQTFSQEMLERLKTNCGDHSTLSLSRILGISATRLKLYIKKFDITFVANSNCFFCKIPKPDNKTKVALTERIRNCCSTHSHEQIGTYLGITTANVHHQVMKFGFRHEKNSNCFVCKCLKEKQKTKLRIEFSEKLEKLKTCCGNHTHMEIGGCLELPSADVFYLIMKHGLKFAKNFNCYICEWKMKRAIKPMMTPETVESGSMQPDVIVPDISGDFMHDISEDGSQNDTDINPDFLSVNIVENQGDMPISRIKVERNDDQESTGTGNDQHVKIETEEHIPHAGSDVSAFLQLELEESL